MNDRLNEAPPAPTTPTPPLPPAPRRSWCRVVLIVSLALNLLVAGVVAGGLLGGAHRPQRLIISDISLGTFTQALSPEDREALRVAAEAESLGLREMHRAANEDFSRLIAALSAEPWDEPGARAAIASYGVRSQDRLRAGERLLLDRLRSMGPKARRDFAGRLEAAMQRGFRIERRGPPPPGN
jgi:uncharacterized membrane protein